MRLLIPLFLAANTFAASITVIVPGTANLWLAGQPNGTTAGGTDSAPGQSPVQVTGLPILPGATISFSATGCVSNVSTPPCNGTPDGNTGGTFATHPAENGVSSIRTPLNSLIGVFLDDSQPTPPVFPGYDYTTGVGLNFVTWVPALRQPFFIGDGLAPGGDVHEFVVPVGATRLFLGAMDDSASGDNTGRMVVTAATEAVPEPSTIALAGAALAALFRLRRQGFAAGRTRGAQVAQAEAKYLRGH